MSAMSTKSVVLPKFEKDVTFQMWWAQFMAYASVAKFTKALKEGGEADLPADDDVDLDETVPAELKQIKAKDRNNVAMACLTIALKTQDDMALVFAATSDEWPAGLAWQVVRALKQKYQPNDITTGVDRATDLRKIKMKPKDVPNKLFEQLSAVNNKYVNRLTPLTISEQVALVVEKAPQQYQALLLSEQKRLGNSVTMAELQKSMGELYRATMAKETDVDDENTGENDNQDKGELLLAMLNGKSAKEQQEMLLAMLSNDVSCYSCGEKGHKSYQCPKKTGNNNNNTHNNATGNSQRFSGKCNNCGKIGHRATRCWFDDNNAHLRPSNWRSGNRNNGTGNSNNEHGNAAVANTPNNNSGGYSIEMLLVSPDGGVASDLSSLKKANLWIADTGATMHSTPHDIAFSTEGVPQTNETITVGNGSGEKAKGIGKVYGTITDQKGNELTQVALDEVALLPTAAFNLFSLTKMIARGWSLYGDNDSIWLQKGENKVIFDIKIKTTRGVLYCMNMNRNIYRTETAMTTTNHIKRMNVNLLHQQLGHCGEADARATAKCLDIDIVRGALKPCEACAKGKCKQKSLPKNTDHEIATGTERRAFLDISTIKRTVNKQTKVIHNGNWRMIVIEREQLKFTDFYNTKDSMIEPTCEKLHKWAQAGKPIKYIRMDNAGENTKFAKRANSVDWKLNLEPEYTARNTPQQNHLVELGFHIITNKSRAMMIAAGIPDDVKYKVAKEAITCATQLDGLVTMNLDDKIATRYEHYCGSNPKFAKHLRVWGEAGTVTLKSDTTPKLANRGETCMMVGYAIQHTGDTYCMWNPTTNRVHTTRDITWLNRMYYAPNTTLPVAVTSIPAGESTNPLVIEAGERERAQRTTDDDDESEASITNEEPTTPTPNNNNNASSDEESESDDDDDDDSTESGDDNDDDTPAAATSSTTKSGRVSKPSARLIEEIGAIATGEFALGSMETMDGLIMEDEADNNLISIPEQRYFDNMMAIDEGATINGEILAMAMELNGGLEEDFHQYSHRILTEVMAVGAGLGGGFANTKELRVMKYEEAMKTADKEKWDNAVVEEHDRFVKHKIWQAVLRKDIPAAAKVLTSTWAMKKKSSGTYRARVNARGYEQIEGQHYDKYDIAAPVTNDITIRIVLVLMILAGWMGELLDVKGAFLHGEFAKGKNLYMEIPKGFERFYDKRLYVLYLLKTIYGLKQAAMAFWKQLLKCFKSMKYKRSKADPCLYYRWTKNGLVLWISWIDDCLVVGQGKNMKKAKKNMIRRFDCDIVGNMNEYVGCKLERDYEKRSIRFTQPVMIQSFHDEFEILANNRVKTPADPGTVLVKCTEANGLAPEMQSVYRSGVGKLLHMMRWSRPDILNAVRELSKHMKVASMAHLKAMEKVMTYVATTPLRGLTLNPHGEWDGKKGHEFIINGMSDSDYAKDPDSRRSISGTSVFLNGAPVCMRSGQQNMTTLSSAEAELVAGTQCAQDMLYVKRILESIGLKVKEPMILQIDNKGAVDLANNWSIGGRTRHIEVRQYFLRELKEAGLIHTRWISGNEMSSDLFTKNLPGAIFRKHSRRYCGVDEYSE